MKKRDRDRLKAERQRKQRSRVWFRYNELTSSQRELADEMAAQVHLDDPTEVFGDTFHLQHVAYRFEALPGGGVRCHVRQQETPFTEAELCSLHDPEENANHTRCELDPRDIAEIEVTEFEKPLLYTTEETGFDEDIHARFKTGFFGPNRVLLDIALTKTYDALPFDHYLEILQANPRVIVQSNSKRFLDWLSQNATATRKLPVDHRRY